MNKQSDRGGQQEGLCREMVHTDDQGTSLIELFLKTHFIYLKRVTEKGVRGKEVLSPMVHSPHVFSGYGWSRLKSRAINF